MENRFEEFKKIILERAKKAESCTPQYKRAYRSESFEELITVIRDNFFWCANNDVITGELIDEYKREFTDGKIWHNENVSEGYLLASGSATVEAYGSATVWAYGSATVWASGSATVEASGSATVEAFNSATVSAFDSAYVRAYGSATVSAFNSATVSAFDSAYVNTNSSIECKLSDFAIARVNNDKICYASDNLKFKKIEEQK